MKKPQNQIKLKLCPFCGNKPIIELSGFFGPVNSKGTTFWFIECEKCDAKMIKTSKPKPIYWSSPPQ